MKIKYFSLLLLTIIIIACDTQNKTQKVDTLAAPITQKAASQSNTQKLLQTIVGTGEGLLRGINFGDAISDVKKKETLELFEDESTHVGYTFDTEHLETVDILYEKDAQSKVSGIQIDIYMNTDGSNDSLKNALENLFSVRYGKPNDESASKIWKIKPEGKVSMKVVKNKLDRGLEVRFTK